MKISRTWIKPLVMAGAIAAFVGYAAAQAQQQRQPPVRFAGAPCVDPPILHCPDADCPADREINQGPVVEMKTRRTYFLDYPCDLKPGRRSH